MKFFRTLLFIFILFTAVQKKTFATYVLPYPSSMPGSLFYKVHVVYEKISQFWYFGDFGNFDYNLKQSDKYLVEARTLFEYKQYLFGYDALIKSDDYFEKVKPALISAKIHGKSIKDKVLQLQEASAAHQEVLKHLLKEIPSRVLWNPEKQKPSNLDLAGEVVRSIKIREENL